MNRTSSQPCRLADGDELLLLVQEGNLRRVKRVLAGGADIDGVDSCLGLPPLIVAAKCGLVKMVKLLLRRGAKVDAAAPRDVLYDSSDDDDSSGDDDCSDDVYANTVAVPSGRTALHTAVCYGRLHVVRLLLRSGGNPNIADSDGYTPLHLVVNLSEAAAMAMATPLLETGADPLLGSIDGELLIHFAAGRGFTDLPKALTSLNRPSIVGDTPLCYAAMKGRESMVLHLLKLGAKQPVVEDKYICCPFKAAIEFDHCGVLLILLKNAEDAISAQGFVKATGYAVLNGRAKSLDAVLSHYDDDTRRNLAQWSPSGLPMLHRAVSRGRLAHVGILLAAGADETATDKDGRCASEVLDANDDIAPVTEDALRRMLERGPAFRAATWSWGARTGMGSPVGSAGDTIVDVPSGRWAGPLSVMIFRPRSKEKFVRRLVGRFARYTLKE